MQSTVWYFRWDFSYWDEANRNCKFFPVSIALSYFSVKLTIALHFKVWKHPNWSREPHRRENWIRQLRWIEEISCSIHSQTSRPQRVSRAFDIDLCSNSRQQLLRDIDATSEYWNGRSLSSESDSMPWLCAKYKTLCKLHRLGCGWHSKVSNDLSNHGWVLNLSEICGQPQEDVCLLIGNSHLIFPSPQVPVKKGEHLTTTYTNTLRPTLERRSHLKQTKIFDCDCKRCSDPTELSTHGSAWICSSSCGGLIESKDPLNNESLWLCGKCCATYSSEVRCQMRNVYHTM